MPAVKVIILTVALCLFFAIVPPSFAASIVINEFFPAPSQGNSEWVEFYNLDSSAVDLSDFYFDDDADFNLDGGSLGMAKIALSGILATQSACYWELPSYLNNNGDVPTLFKADGNVVDTYSYSSSQTDKSYSRVPDGENWQANIAPTKASTRCIDLAPAQAVDPPSVTITPAPAPKIDWALEDKIYVAKEFKTTKLELSNFDINTEYFLKLRAGTEEGKLTKLQTKNGNAYLSDGEVWSKFPLIKTNENAKWTGEIKGLLAEGKPDGKYKIRLRIRKKDTDTYLESDTKEITFLPEIIEIAPVIVQPKVLAASIEAKINLATPAPMPAPVPTPLPAPIPTKSYLSQIFIISGAILILLAIIALWKSSPELFTKLKIWEKN